MLLDTLVQYIRQIDQALDALPTTQPIVCGKCVNRAVEALGAFHLSPTAAKCLVSFVRAMELLNNTPHPLQCVEKVALTISIGFRREASVASLESVIDGLSALTIDDAM